MGQTIAHFVHLSKFMRPLRREINVSLIILLSFVCFLCELSVR